MAPVSSVLRGAATRLASPSAHAAGADAQGVAPVSRETHTVLHKQRRGDRTRRRLIDAVVAFAHEGRYRAAAEELATWAGVERTALYRHFGAVDLLYRVVAREHWSKVRLPFSTASLPDPEARAAVWAVLVGQPRELS